MKVMKFFLIGLLSLIAAALFAGELAFFGTEAVARLAGQDHPAALYVAFGVGAGILILPNLLIRPVRRRRK